jgi:hypothetical protein
MKIAVVYESTFGNTATVAAAIAERLRPAHTVDLVSVDLADASTIEGVDLLIAGGPTHAHGLSWPTTRKAPLEEAAKKGESVTPVTDPEEGLREWTKLLGHVEGVPAAVFDTRIHKSRALVGSAAHVLARKLHHHGFRLVGEPESFFVADVQGPLEADAVDHAHAWADQVVAQAATAHA